MNLYKLYKKIMKKETYNDLNFLLGGFDSFEEFPIISRDRRVEKLQVALKQEDVSEFLLGFAFFLLNTVQAMARDSHKKLGLTAITFTKFDDDCGPTLVPKIFIYPGAAANDLRQKLIKNRPRTDSPEMTKVKNVFTACSLFESFLFLESRFFDKACDEEVIRIYAIPHHGNVLKDI